MPGGIIPPLSVIATWPKPNYVDPVTQGPALMVLGIVLGSITTLLVAVRIYSRIFITRAPGIDDLLIFISLSFSLALTALVILQTKNYGTGRHLWDVPPSDFVGNRKNIWECEWCYIIATCSVKISIMLFYRRLSSNFNRVFFIATWIGIVFNIGYLVTFLLLVGFNCRPIRAYWMQVGFAWATTNTFACVDEHLSLPISAATSVLGDFYATSIPCILILKLDLPMRQKVALYGIFLLGFLVVAAGAVRTYFLNHLINETYDNTWYLWKFWIWTFVELYISIVAASAPALKPFFCRYLLDPISSLREGSSSYMRTGKSWSNEAPSNLESNSGSTAPVNGCSDMEKIGMAVGGDETRIYELVTLPNGKVEPVQVFGRPQQNVNLQSGSQARRLHPRGPSEWTLPPAGPWDDNCPLATWRAEIEALSPAQGGGRPAPTIRPVVGSRSVTPSGQMTSGSAQGSVSALPRYPSPSTVRGGPERKRSHNTTHRAGAQATPTARRAVQDRDDHNLESPRSDTSSNIKTLHLLRRPNVTSVDQDDESLPLPRPGYVDEEPVRLSQVGIAL